MDRIMKNFRFVLSVLFLFCQIASGANVTGTADQVIRVPHAGGQPKAGSIDLSQSATVGVSVLGAANGGLGLSSPGSAGNVATSNGSAWVSSAPASGATLFNNLGITGTIGSNILTVNVTTQTGATPSGSSPVQIGFRHTTLATGQYLVGAISAALSIAAPNGASLGLANAQLQTIYIYLQYNSGTPELCLAGTRTFDQTQLQTTTTISSGSTSNSVLYCSTGRSSQPIRFVGALTLTESTAGTYASAVTSITPFTTDGSTPRSEVYVDTGNGKGSSSTSIRRYSTTQKSIGTAITYADSSTLGASFTINEPGVFCMRSEDVGTGEYTGVSLNTSAPATDCGQLTYAQGRRACVANPNSSTIPGTASWCGVLNVGDVIRPHIAGGNVNGTDQNYNFSIIKVTN